MSLLNQCPQGSSCFSTVREKEKKRTQGIQKEVKMDGEYSRKGEDSRLQERMRVGVGSNHLQSTGAEREQQSN